MSIYERIAQEQRSIENDILGGHPIQLAYRASGVSVSGWIGGHYETVSSGTVAEAAVKFKDMLNEHTPSAENLRKQARALLAKAEAMEGGKL
jgi:hypothetical protein